MLLDSNILIDGAQPAHHALRGLIRDRDCSVSVISRIEVLGFHRLAPDERIALEALFGALEVFPLSEAVTLEAIRLRQRRSMTLGDAVIAATALVQARTLATRDSPDFDGIPGLTVWDPFADVEPAG